MTIKHRSYMLLNSLCQSLSFQYVAVVISTVDTGVVVAAFVPLVAAAVVVDTANATLLLWLLL